MPTARKRIRIFISSPGDVIDEREKAHRVIDDLQRHFSNSVLEPVLWEELALPATASFQETIDHVIQREPIDIAVFILWSRLGSPLGPSVKREDGSRYRSGTEREFDVMLNAFEKSGRKRPVILAYTRMDDTGFRQVLNSCDRTELESLVTQRNLAEAFVRENFTDADGHNIRAFHTYSEPVGFAQRFRTHLRQILNEKLEADTTQRWFENPYRGLEVFDIPQSVIYRGREEETCDLLQRLRDQEQSGCAFVVIVGASGSGKSSLALAGVGGALSEHAYDDRVKSWRIVRFMPALDSTDLVLRLSQAIAGELPEIERANTTIRDIANGLKKDPTLTVKLSVVPAFGRAAIGANGAIRLLVIVDQLEELWTDRNLSQQDRIQFFEALEALACSGRIAVLATLRSDFYPQAQSLPAFLRLKGGRGHFDLLPPSIPALQRMITEPALLAGIKFERDEQSGKTLDQTILEDASQSSSTLPLLQYVLAELYQQRNVSKSTLTYSTYSKLGGLLGALANKATTTYKNLPDDVQAALVEILPHLVTIEPDELQTVVRRRSPLSDLTKDPATSTLTEHLISARLLIADRQGNQSIVSLAHETLIDKWDQIANWVSINRNLLRLRSRVEQSETQWKQSHKDKSLLLASGLPLEEGQSLLAQTRLTMSPSTIAYIEQSVAFRTAESHGHRRTKVTAIATSFLAIIASLVAIILWLDSERRTESAARIEANNAQNQEKSERENSERQQAETNREFASLVSDREATTADDVAGAFMSLRTAQYLSRIPKRVATEIDTQAIDDLKLKAFHQASDVIGTYVMPSDLRDIEIYKDGSCVIVSCGDEAIRSCDMTGSTVVELYRHKKPVNGMRLSHDGDHILSWSRDGTAIVWNIKARSITNVLSHFVDSQDDVASIKGAVFSPDDSLVLTWSDYAVKLWNITDSKLVMSFVHKSRIIEATLSRNNNVICTRHDDGKVGKLIGRSPTAVLEFYEFGEPVSGMLASTDGSKVLVWGSESNSKLWDSANTGTDRPYAISGPVVGARFNQNESKILTWSRSGVAMLWNCAGDVPPASLAPDGAISRADFVNDDLHIVTWGHGVHLHDLSQSPQQVKKISSIHTDNGRFSQNRSLIIAAATKRKDSGAVTLADFSGQIHLHIYEPREISDAWIMPGDSQVLTRHGDRTLSVRHVYRPNLIGQYRHEYQTNGFAMSSDESQLLTWSRLENVVKLWDTRSSAELRSIPLKSYSKGACFYQNGTRVLTWSDDGVATGWDSNVAEPLGSAFHGSRDPNVIVSANEDKFLTWSGIDNSVCVWNAADFTLLSKLKHEGTLLDATFSSDGTRILSWSTDKTVCISKLGELRPGVRIQHDRDVMMAKFSPDEKVLLTLEKGANAVRLWDSVTGNMRISVSHSDLISGAAFIADGSRVLSWSRDKTARIWNITEQNSFEEYNHGETVVSVSLSADESKLLTVGTEKLAVWNINDRSIREPIWTNSSENFDRACFDKSGLHVLAWRMKTGGVASPLGAPLPMTSSTRALPFGARVKILGPICVGYYGISSSSPLVYSQVMTDSCQFSKDEKGVLSLDSQVRHWRISDPMTLLTPDERVLELEVRSGLELKSDLTLKPLEFEAWRKKRESDEYLSLQHKIKAMPTPPQSVMKVQVEPKIREHLPAPAPPVEAPAPPVEAAPAPPPPNVDGGPRSPSGKVVEPAPMPPPDFEPGVPPPVPSKSDRDSDSRKGKGSKLRPSATTTP